MTAYLLFMCMPVAVELIFVLFTRKSVDSSDRLKKRYLTVCCIFLFFMIALMYHGNGSGDAMWYYNNWKYMEQVNISGLPLVLKSIDMESGYLISVWLLSHIFPNPQFVFVFYGLLIAITFGKFFYKNCEHLSLAFTMLCCLGLWGFMVQGLRQGIAMCICLIAFEYAKKKKPVPFILLVLLAMAFHAAAFAFLIVYFLHFLKMNFKNYILFALGVGLFFIALPDVLLLFDYLLNDTHSMATTARTQGGFATVVVYSLSIVSALFTASNEKQNESFSIVFYMLLIGTIAFLMRYNVSTITGRISYFFMISQNVMLPKMIDIFSQKNNSKLLLKSLILILCIGVAVYKMSYSVLVPFYFCWQM